MDTQLTSLTHNISIRHFLVNHSTSSCTLLNLQPKILLTTPHNITCIDVPEVSNGIHNHVLELVGTVH